MHFHNPFSLHCPPQNLPCHMVIFPPFPVPDAASFQSEAPLVPAVDHELVLRDGPVLVNVHPAEQLPGELVRSGLVVLVVQQAQDRLNNLTTDITRFICGDFPQTKHPYLIFIINNNFVIYLSLVQ